MELLCHVFNTHNISIWTEPKITKQNSGICVCLRHSTESEIQVTHFHKHLPFSTLVSNDGISKKKHGFISHENVKRFLTIERCIVSIVGRKDASGSVVLCTIVDAELVLLYYHLSRIRRVTFSAPYILNG